MVTFWRITLGLALALVVSSPLASYADEVDALTPATAADVLEAVRAPGARAVLVNVWATWCAPCVEEMPYLVRLQREYGAAGLRLVLVSADFAEQSTEAAAFLARQGVEGPSFIKTEKDEAFIDAINPEWGGALPASLLYDGAGNLHHFWEGAASYEDFESRVQELLD